MMDCGLCKTKAVHKVMDVSTKCVQREITLHAEVQDIHPFRSKYGQNFTRLILQDDQSQIETLMDATVSNRILQNIKENQSYTFKGMYIKPVNKAYTDVGHPFEIWLKDFTSVLQSEAPAALDIPLYTAFADLVFSNYIRLVGILVNVEPVTVKMTVNGDKSFRNIRLRDKHGDEFDVALWANKTDLVTESVAVGSVVALTGVKVGRYKGMFTLSSTYRMTVKFDPVLNETQHLRELQEELELQRNKRKLEEEEADVTTDDGDNENRKKIRISREDPDGCEDAEAVAREDRELRAINDTQSPFGETSAEDGNTDNISGLDPMMMDRFLRILKEGEVNQTSIRIMLIGHGEVGKTTLAQNILGQSVENVQSTNGIDIQVYHTNEVNGRLKILNSKQRAREGMKSIANEARQMPCQENVSHEETVSSTEESGDCIQDSGYSSLESTISSTAEQAVSSSGDTLHKNVGKSFVLLSTNEDRKAKKVNREKLEKIPSIQKPLLSSRYSAGEFKKACEDKSLPSRMLSVWDFGGQFSFYVTHQLFLSSSAVYLLVLDLRKHLNTKVEDRFSSDESRDVQTFCKFWLETIYAFVGNSHGYPKVVLVGTHFDELEKEERGHVAKMKLNKVRELFEESPVFRHIHQKDFFVSRTECQDEVDDLMNCVTKLAEEQQQEKVKANWILLENILLQMKNVQRHMTFQELCDINKDKNQMPVPVEDEDNLKLFLLLQHCKGNLLYFNVGKLSEIIVLDPQWIVDAFKCIITAKKFEQKDTQMWRELNEDGILRPDLVTAVWKNDSANDFAGHREVLLLYLEQLCVIADACISNEDYTEKNHEQKPHYIVPSKLKKDIDAEIKQLAQDYKSKTLNIQFAFRFRNGFVPVTLFHKVIASAVRRWKLLKRNRKTMIFHDGAAFELDLVHAGVICLRENMSIDIDVLNLCGKAVDEGYCDILRRFVHKILLEELHCFRDGKAKSQFDLAVRCDLTECDGPDYHKLDDLKTEKYQSVPCLGCIGKPHNIVVCHIAQKWFPYEPRSVRLVYLMNQNPLCFQYLTEELSERDVNSLAYQAIESLDHLDEALGITPEYMNELEKSVTNHHIKIKKVILRWRKTSQVLATWHVFLELLDKSPRVRVNKDKLQNIFDSLSLSPRIPS